MKILGKLLLFTTLFLYNLHAEVRATLNTEVLRLGDTAVLTIQASGEEVQMPQIDTLCGVDVLSTSRATNVQVINGNYSNFQKFSYTFEPTHDCTIEPIAVKIGDKYESTDPLTLKVKQIKTEKDAPFILTMQTDKKEVYVGEPFKLIVTLKQRYDAEAVDSKFTPPKLQNFWIKEQKQSQRTQEGEYGVVRLVYIVAAQKSGKLHIGRGKLQVAQRSHARDAWGQWFPQLQWRSFYTNELDIDVKPLPQGVTLVGDFHIDATVDNDSVDANQAVNLTITVDGEGNFEDIGSLKPHIEGVNIFDEEPTIKGKFVQKMAIVANEDFTIPPITLTYFDLKTKQVKTISTKPLHVSVKHSKKTKSEPVEIERAKSETPTVANAAKNGGEHSSFALIAAFAVGVSFGALLLLIPWKKIVRQEKRTHKVSIKDERAVLNLLMRHIEEDEEVRSTVRKLEQRLYEGKSVDIDKKALKALVAKYTKK